MGHLTADRALAVVLGMYIVGCAVSQSLMSLASSILCVWAVVDVIRRWRSGRLQNAKLFVPIIAYVFLGLGILVLRATQSFPVEWKALELLPLILIGFWPLAWSASERERFLRQGVWLERALLAGAIAYALSAGRAVYEGFVVGRMATAWMKNPIYLGYNLLFALVLLGAVLPKLARSWRTPALGLYVLLLAAIFATNSRMALLVAALLSTALLGRWMWRELPRLVLVGLLALFAGLATYEYQTKPYVRARVASALDFTDLSWRGRLQAWEHNRALIRENPILGVGPKQNGLYTRDLAPEWQALWGANVVIFAHSIYLQLLAEVGVLGFLLFAAGLAALFAKLPLTRPVVLALVLGGLTENILSNSKPLHAFLMALIVAGMASAKQLNPRKRSA